MGLPERSGLLKDVTRFDASFFNVHPKQADVMDPQIRNLLEITYEAIVDAGKLSLVVRKPVFGGSDQIRHKPG